MTAHTEQPVGGRQAHSLKRPWYRLHLSTWVAALLATALWTAVILAGERHPPAQVAHGWPLQFLTREAKLVLAAPPGFRPNEIVWWPTLSLWSWTDHVREFDLVRLAVDAGLALLGLVLLCWVTELRRRRARRFWQLSLRELAAAVLVPAALCGYWGSLYRETSRQATTLRALDDVLAHAPYGYGVGSSRWQSRYEIQWQTKGDWFLELFWDEETKPRWFAEVVSLKLTVEQDAADEAVALVGQLPSLEELSVELFGGSRRLSDQGVQTIANLQGLRSLTINRMGGNWDMSAIGLNDAQVAYLARLSDLRTLDLSNNCITDEGLRHLRGLKRLETLEVSKNPITDAGVDDLTRSIPGLMVLDD